MRDYVNYNYKKNRQRRDGKRPLWVLGMIFSFLGVGLGVYYFYTQQHLSLANIKNDTVVKVTSFFPQIFQRHKTQLSVKKEAVAVEVEKPLHFDFYDELPKAKLQLPAKIDEPVISKAASTSMATTASVPVLTPQLEEKNTVVRPVDSGSYILQVGVFHNLEAANRYHGALAAAGLKVDVVRVKEGNEVIYRLQQGPYHNLDQLRLAKKKMAGRGVACEVRKIAS
jgi:cell division protein FtsN